MQFNKKVFRPENVSIFGGTLFRLLDIVCLNRAVDFTRETTAQSNQTGRPRCEKLFIDPRRVMKSVQMRCRYEFHEISLTCLVFSQYSAVIRRIAPRCRSLLARSSRPIRFA